MKTTYPLVGKKQGKQQKKRKNKRKKLPNTWAWEKKH
jgi:hypothetical protein